MTLEALPRPHEVKGSPSASEPSRTWSFIGRISKGFAKTLALGASVFLIAGSNCDQGVGDPCTPEQEYNTDFLGFDVKEVNVESKSFQCRTRLCLVNHFQGRASCPYGQDPQGSAPAGAQACTVPGTSTKIEGKDSTGAFLDPKKQALVQPQCVDRAADKAVYCSCRCADINGDKPGDQTFCDCPDGFECTRLVTSIGGGVQEGLTGSYCIKKGTAYDPTTACTQGTCDPANKNAPCAAQ